MQRAASLPVGGKRYLSNPSLARRYDVDVRTIKRWQGDPELGFPAPDLEINGRDYTSENRVEDFEERRRVAATVVDKA
jgi:hypothetical protein